MKVKLFNPANLKKSSEVNVLVDSGTIYSVVPQEILRKIGIQPHSKETFTLANGEFVENGQWETPYFITKGSGGPRPSFLVGAAQDNSPPKIPSA